mmetsp:Transcript_35927/g.86828  ORF Transcript_35927/g.86828 Transcript_35927/m.86828 type:complete len:976 (-) Transcript_35927:1624-4551(-)
MTTIEVILTPDFHSDSCYTILGCGRSGSPEELRKSYRDLSRKYHPDRYRANKETNHTFQRVYVAYSLICRSPQEGRDVKFDREAMRQVSLEDAKREYENEFGDYKGKHYSKGAIVALPYPFELRERLERGKCFREAFTLQIGCLQFSFFRSFLIKKELGVLFLLSEIICVWGSLILAVWNLLLEDFPEVIDEIPYVRDTGIEEIPHISIIGGIAVLIGSFVQHFWYGFTRHPIITDSGYGNWLWDGETSSSGEVGEILRTCSQYYHSDDYKRSQVLTLLLCFPFLLVDHIPAILMSIPVYLFFLCQNCGTTRNQSTGEHLAYQFAKSIGALLVVVGIYLAWVLGGNYAKLACAGVLYVNQHLYSAILFRKSVFGFLQSIIFQGFFAITIVRRPREQTTTKGKRNTDATDIEQGMPREKKESAPSAVKKKAAAAKTRNEAPSPASKRNQVSPQKVIEEEVIDIVPVVSTMESPQKTPASGVRQKDPDDFGAKFDGFYRSPRSYAGSTKSQPSLAPTTDASENTEKLGGEKLVVDHRGKKYIKPVPGWYTKGEVITDTQYAAQNAQQAPKGFENINIFQCGTDTTAIEDGKDGKFGDTGAASINGDKETATGLASGITSTKASTTFTSPTKASTAFTSHNSKMEEKQGDEAEGPDLVNLARSAKRRIEAEFYARIYGSPAGPGMSSPVSPERRAASRRALFAGEEQEQKQHRLGVPPTIEIKTPKAKGSSKSTSPISPSTTSLMDNTSRNASENASSKTGEIKGDRSEGAPSDESSTRMDNMGFIPMYGQADRQVGNGYPPTQKRSLGNKADKRPKSPEGDIDNLLGPFVPLVKSATTRSNSYSVGASQATKMQSNKEREMQKQSDKEREMQLHAEEPTGFVLQHHPGKGLSGYRHADDEEIRYEKRKPEKSKLEKPRRSRTTGQIPDLVVGYDQASADESEITMDRRQFQKQEKEAPTFWNYWTNPSNSTLTRSVQ